MIFYYTATGNCLYVARQIEDNVYSIPQELKKENLEYKDDKIGIVAPIYAGELPQTVRRFIEKAKFDTSYFYMLLTYGNKDSVAGVWSEKFCRNHGIKVDFIQTVLMVDNYLPSFDMDEQMAMNKHVDEQIQKAKKKIDERQQSIPQPTQEGIEAYQMVSQRFTLHPELNNGETIQMTLRCVGCSICEQVCPIGNIKMVNGKAQRISKTCDFCLACVQNCPFLAIGLKIDKNPSARYRHPKITLKDIVQSNHQGGIEK